MLYNDAVTLTTELIGPVTYEFVPAGTRTIVGFSIQQSGVASQTRLLCGTTVLAINYGKDLPHNEVNYLCTQKIIASKTGQDSSSVIVTYVPRNLNAEVSNSVLITGNIDIATTSAYHAYTKDWNDIGLFVISLGIVVILTVLGGILARLMFPKNI